MLVAISLAQNSSLGELFEVLENSSAVLLWKTSDILSASSFHQKEKTPLAFSASTVLRKTAKQYYKGTDWATAWDWNELEKYSDMPWNLWTLYRRRIEFGLENDFTEITDKELDRQIQQTLNLTPCGGETYVRGSLKDRGINIQRFRIRESW